MEDGGEGGRGEGASNGPDTRDLLLSLSCFFGIVICGGPRRCEAMPLIFSEGITPTLALAGEGRAAAAAAATAEGIYFIV